MIMRRKLKLENKDIVFVSNALANGGAARVMSVLANEFNERGVKVGIAVFSQLEGEYSVSPSVAKEYGPQGSGFKAKIDRVVWLRDVVKRNPGAAIVAFEYFVNMQTILAGTGLPNRVVVSERNDPARVGNKFDWIRERLYRRADMLVCQTDEAADYFSDKVKKCVILNPLKDDLPEPFAGVRRKAVVTFCRLEPQKNLSMLLRAFAKFYKSHPDYSLEIYGDGSERESLLSLAADLNIAACTSINPSRSDILEVVRDAAMFVLPSNYEGLSNSMLEAMAIGLPCICTDCPCGGARMVIEDGVNGYLVPVGDDKALLERMELADDCTALQMRMEYVCKLRARLSIKDIANKWLKVIEE
jgi:GalNAc-alpha-(1->4)-GalNAc-alpha-(1->3)-diNAcBac-PP-undecaprenol alpha-1,4-N-acetyl-D-galactosaminyltransferase